MDLGLRNSTTSDARGPAAASSPTTVNPRSSRPDAPDGRTEVEVSHGSKRGVRTAQGMAWFSVGLGLTQLLAPRLLARVIGANHTDGTLMRLCGARELAAGVGLLTSRDAATWSAVRLAGDVLDLALLGVAMLRPGNSRGRLAVAATAVAGAAALDLYAVRQLAGEPERAAQVAAVTRVGKAITIAAPAADLYAFWRHLPNLASLLDHVVSVEEGEDGHARWTGEAPGGVPIHWDSVITDDQPDQRLAWRAVGTVFESAGSIRFRPAPGDRGTEVVVELEYRLLGRAAGKALAFATGREPGFEVDQALRVLKQIFEIGEPMRSDASIHRGLHPGRPPGPDERTRLDPPLAASLHASGDEEGATS